MGGERGPMTEIPDGFTIYDRKSPFLEPIGPIYRKDEGRTLVIGLTIETRHTNARGFVHGGMISTLADIALGHALSLADEPPKSALTASLTVDLFGAAKVGDWIEVRAQAKRVGGKLAFSAADVLADGAAIGQATAVFRVTR